MGSVYIQPGEYVDYGISTATASQVSQASLVVDAAINRPEGLLWAPDFSGQPAYMSGLDASFTQVTTAPLAAGTNVVIPIPAYLATPDLIGEVVIINRAAPLLCEALVVNAVGTGTMTVDKLSNAQSSGVTLEFGLTITEEKSLPSRRNVTRVMRGPLVRLMSAKGRYGYPRRSAQFAGLNQDFNLLAAVNSFGGPPLWYAITTSQCSISPVTGEIWLPSGMLMAPWSEARVRYVAGFPASNVPDAIKNAVSFVVQQLIRFPEMGGNTRSLRAGDTEVGKFADTLLDADTKATLDPFRSRAFV